MQWNWIDYLPQCGQRQGYELDWQLSVVRTTRIYCCPLWGRQQGYSNDWFPQFKDDCKDARWDSSVPNKCRILSIFKFWAKLALIFSEKQGRQEGYYIWLTAVHGEDNVMDMRFDWLLSSVRMTARIWNLIACCPRGRHQEKNLILHICEVTLVLAHFGHP